MNRMLPHLALLLAGVSTSALAADGHAPPPTAPVARIAETRLAPFAAQLAETPRAAPGQRPAVDIALAWSLVAKSTAETRQGARWKLAAALLDRAHGEEAIGVLETMRRDDDALKLVPAWRLAMGAASVLAGRDAAARDWLNIPELAADAEACAWRLRAGVPVDRPLLKCAIPAIVVRPTNQRGAFVAAAADALLKIGEPGPALRLLAAMPEQDPAANLRRGIALVRTGQDEAARLKFERVQLSGAPGERAAAELELILLGVDAKKIGYRQATKRLDALMLSWRGDATERAAIELKRNLAQRVGDRVAVLTASATLFRYFDLGADTPGALTAIQAELSTLIADRNRPIAEAAGLFWEYRDLAPTGAAGDLMVTRLSERLADAGLHSRAAELLSYQMTARAVDIAKGPLSIRIARLLLQAGKPDHVLAALRLSDGPAYPDAIAAERRRMQVIATYRMGRREDALAMLDQLADADALRAEMLWQARDWKRFVQANRNRLPTSRTAVLRQAVALTMVGDDAGLTALRRQHGAALRGTPAGAALDALAAPDGKSDPAALDAAMAGLGDTQVDGDLLLLGQS
ncbi:endoglucanase [Sphingomonas sp. ST-64]|uniref:Endoglucanase n=1 Tax=Sphingomonas plantiphila TaxID=3163295 RepID=A0ABW8YNU9_9SPHN